MKKICRGIGKLFSHIGAFFDRILITPITKLILKITDFSKKNAKSIERFLGRKQTLIVISLLVALCIFFIIDGESSATIDQYAEVLYDQPVTATYNEEAYVVEGVPKSVDITLIGRKSDLYLAKQIGEHEVVLDLSDYKPGTYKVKLKYNHNIDSVNYKLDPSTINVKISKKVSSEKNIEYDLLNEDKLNKKLSIKSVKLDRNSVYVRGSEETLNKIAKVKALIDLKAANLTEKGTFTIDSIILVAYASDGSIIENVETVPAKINASVVVDSYYAELPVKVTTTGNLKNGYAISNLTSSIQKVSVYGDEEAIKNLQYIEASLSVDDLSENDKECIRSLIGKQI